MRTDGYLQSFSKPGISAMLYAGHGRQQGARRKAEPDWAYVHHEPRRPGVTLMLLWEEYGQREPESLATTRAKKHPHWSRFAMEILGSGQQRHSPNCWALVPSAPGNGEGFLGSLL
jgi:hypothetical protein